MKMHSAIKAAKLSLTLAKERRWIKCTSIQGWSIWPPINKESIAWSWVENSQYIIYLKQVEWVTEACVADWRQVRVNLPAIARLSLLSVKGCCSVIGLLARLLQRYVLRWR